MAEINKHKEIVVEIIDNGLAPCMGISLSIKVYPFAFVALATVEPTVI